jgi:Barstar (barnase inhibitor)
MDRYVAPAATKRDAIGAVYAAVQAPQWAAPNLDGLIDVLRDLSWLPPGPVVLHWPDQSQLPADDERAIRAALHTVAEETAETDRPVSVEYPGVER